MADRPNTTAAEPLPGYWMHETSGVLAPAMRAYLAGGELTPAHVETLRAYLRQWMAAEWRGPEIPALRERIGGLASRASFTRWFADALEAGIDPL